MPVKLYSSDLEISEVKFPKLLKFILHFYNDPINEPITKEKLKKARNSEKKIGKGIFKFLIYGFSPKLSKVEDIKFETYNLRIYRPKSNGSLPVIIFYHGGGYVLGSIESYDPICRRLAKDLNTLIISVNYRLSPEFPFPVALNDSYSAILWVKDHLFDLDADVDKIFVMGDSTGGGLATLVALRNKKRNDFALKGQILIYPWVSGNFNYKSFEYFKEGYGLSKKLMNVFRKCYICNSNDFNNPEFSPIDNKDLSKLPETFIVTASHDVLRDQGILYTKKLIEAGNRVIYKNYLQTIHGFFTYYKVLPRGKKMYHDIINTLRKMLND